MLRERGRTLQDELDAIARRWGVFTSTQVNVTRKGASGVGRHPRDDGPPAGLAPARASADDEVLAVSRLRGPQPRRPARRRDHASHPAPEQRPRVRARVRQPRHRPARAGPSRRRSSTSTSARRSAGTSRSPSRPSAPWPRMKKLAERLLRPSPSAGGPGRLDKARAFPSSSAPRFRQAHLNRRPPPLPGGTSARPERGAKVASCRR